MKNKSGNIILSQSDALACSGLYHAKYFTYAQLIGLAYNGYSERSASNRITKLVKFGFAECFRVTLPPGSHSALDPFNLALQGGAHGGRFPLAMAGISGDRDQITKVYFLGSEGERWVSSLVQNYRPAGHRVRPFTRDNWSHELSVSRLFVEMFQGTRPDRLENISKWNWITPYRGTSAPVPAYNRSDIRKITPDAVIRFQGRGRTIFLEMDRGTKAITAEHHQRQFNHTVAGNLAAYSKYFRSEKNRPQATDFVPQLLYVVPNEKRAEDIRMAFRSAPDLVAQGCPEPMALSMRDAIRYLWEWAYRTKFEPKHTPVQAPPDVTANCSKEDVKSVLRYLAQLNSPGIPVHEVERLARFANS